MSRDGRKLTKQPIPEGVTEGVSAPPPMETVPDMAETLHLLEKISRMPTSGSRRSSGCAN